MSSNNCPEVSSKEEISHDESDDDYEVSSHDDSISIDDLTEEEKVRDLHKEIFSGKFLFQEKQNSGRRKNMNESTTCGTVLQKAIRWLFVHKKRSEDKV